MAAAHRVEEVEANRELVAEPRVHRLAQQRAWLGEHKVNRRNLQAQAAEPKQQAELKPGRLERRKSRREALLGVRGRGGPGQHAAIAHQSDVHARAT